MVKIPEIYEIGNGIPFPDYTNGTVINAADVGPINGIVHSRLFTINQPGWVYLYSYSESFFRINITGAPDPTTLTELHTFPFVAKNYTGGQGYMDCISFIPVQRACKIYLNNEVNENDQTTHSLVIYYPFVKSPVTPPEGCVSYVIETGHNADNTAFYRKYSDGYIEQWGLLSKNAGYYASSPNSRCVTFATEFTSSKYTISITKSSSKLTTSSEWKPDDNIGGCYNISTSGFWIGNNSKTDVSKDCVTFHWRACGY